jgi:hypothetical protein
MADERDDIVCQLGMKTFPLKAQHPFLSPVTTIL